jgi:hypothetical protein
MTPPLYSPSGVKVPVSTLPGSALHKLCVEMYLRHQGAGAARCAQCEQPTPCSPRQRAASVIVAAGEDPRSYDPQAWRSPPGGAVSVRADNGNRSDQPIDGDAISVRVIGYHLGGVGRRTDLPYHEYER